MALTTVIQCGDEIPGDQEAIYVHGRSSFATPFPLAPTAPPYAQWESLELYRRYLKYRPDLLERARRELRGRALICYCPFPEECHAQVLARVAEGGEP